MNMEEAVKIYQQCSVRPDGECENCPLEGKKNPTICDTLVKLDWLLEGKE